MAEAEIDQVQAVAITLVCAALWERCEDLIQRIAGDISLKAETEDFRSKALRHVVRHLSTDLSLVAGTEAIQAAMDQINEACDGWRGNWIAGG